jgi:hypothetical protein
MNDKSAVCHFPPQTLTPFIISFSPPPKIDDKQSLCLSLSSFISPDPFPRPEPGIQNIWKEQNLLIFFIFFFQIGSQHYKSLARFFFFRKRYTSSVCVDPFSAFIVSQQHACHIDIKVCFATNDKNDLHFTVYIYKQ